jgi:hypothetical protein
MMEDDRHWDLLDVKLTQVHEAMESAAKSDVGWDETKLEKEKCTPKRVLTRTLSMNAMHVVLPTFSRRLACSMWMTLFVIFQSEKCTFVTEKSPTVISPWKSLMEG